MKKLLKRIIALIMLMTICVTSIYTSAYAQTSWDSVSKSRVYKEDGFKVTMSLSSYWNGGYNADIKIENTSDTAKENWYLGFEYDDVITNIWNAEIVADESGYYVIKNATWNQDIAPKSYVQFGFSSNEDFDGFPEEIRILGKCTKVRRADYTIEYHLDNDWGSGFAGTVFITNNTDEVIEDWQLKFDFNRNITNIWNAQITNKDEHCYVIKNVGYNSNIEAGQTISFGFVGCDGKAEDNIENYQLFTYGINNIEYVELSDGDIDKEYLEKAIYPNMMMRDLDIEGVKLSDDYDQDGLTLEQEYAYDTNPFSKDTDEDGINDYDEINIYMTNPLKYDTDEDEMSDGTEVDCGLNPLIKDTDGNGINDGCEVITQNVRLYSIKEYDVQEVGTLP